jgi:hypothetical protein
VSLIKREPTPAQIAASRANGRLSTGPRTARGKRSSSRNLARLRPFTEVVAQSMSALGERTAELDQMHRALAAAMEPRDAWEAAWVQDIAILRWRISRLQRAEVGVLAVRKRKLSGDRKRKALPPSGSAEVGLREQVSMLGFCSLPDSAWKFQRVIELLEGARDLGRGRMFEPEGMIYFDLLYGKSPGTAGAMLRGRFEALSKRQAENGVPDRDEQQIALIAAVNQEIDHYQARQALLEAEHRDDDPIRLDADLLLAGPELDEIIRYETHLEDQIERKLRQFYARRREPAIQRQESMAVSPVESAEIVLAGTPASTQSRPEDASVQSRVPKPEKLLKIKGQAG